MQIHTIFVALADLADEGLVSFYRALFAVEPTLSIPQVYTEFQLPGLRLGIFQPKANHRTEFNGSAGAMSLCVEVEDLALAIEHLTQMGCPSGEIMTASHGREVYAYDPAGNRLILHERAR